MKKNLKSKTIKSMVLGISSVMISNTVTSFAQETSSQEVSQMYKEVYTDEINTSVSNQSDIKVGDLFTDSLGFIYKLLNDNNLALVGYDNSKINSNVSSPITDLNMIDLEFGEIQINGTSFKITEIGNGENAVFKNFEFLSYQNFKFPNVTKVNDYAFFEFNTSNFVSFDLSSVTEVGAYAFNKFYSYGTLTLGSTSNLITKVGENAFNIFSSTVESKIYVGTLTEIGEGAFDNISTGIKFLNSEEKSEITISKDITEIPDKFFANYINENEVTIKVEDGSKLTKIGDYAFAYSNSNVTVDLTKATSLTTLGNYAFANSSSTLTNGESVNLKLPENNNISIIECSAFENYSVNNNLELGFNGSITKIGAKAFSNFDGTGKITLSFGEITEIGEGAFEDAKSENIEINSNGNNNQINFDDTITKIPNNLFSGYDGELTIIAKNITEIGDSAFENASNITFDLSSLNLQVIGDNAFAYSKSEDNNSSYIINNLETVQKIGDNAFKGNDKITKNDNSIPLISNNAVIYLKSATNVGENSFTNSSIVGAIVTENLATVGNEAFSGLSINGVINLENNGINVDSFKKSNFENVTIKGASSSNLEVLKSIISENISSNITVVTDDTDVISYLGTLNSTSIKISTSIPTLQNDDVFVDENYIEYKASVTDNSKEVAIIGYNLNSSNIYAKSNYDYNKTKKEVTFDSIIYCSPEIEEIKITQLGDGTNSILIEKYQNKNDINDLSGYTFNYPNVIEVKENAFNGVNLGENAVVFEKVNIIGNEAFSNISDENGIFTLKFNIVPTSISEDAFKNSVITLDFESVNLDESFSEVINSIKSAKEVNLIVNTDIEEQLCSKIAELGLSDNVKVNNKGLESSANETITTYKVIIYSNGGKFSNGTESIEVEITKGSIDFNFEIPTRNGYDFLGWYVKSEDGKEDKALKDVITELKDGSIIYAKWEENSINNNTTSNENSATSGSSSGGSSGNSSNNVIENEQDEEEITEELLEEELDIEEELDTIEEIEENKITKEFNLENIILPTIDETKEVDFNDISRVSWAEESIEKLAKAGIINGEGNGRFNPSGNTKRADIVIMAVKLLGLDGIANTNFNDVDSNKYYYNYVGLAKDYGIINGNDGNFKPEENISRQDAMVMIANILKQLDFEVNTNEEILTKFNDFSTISSYAIESVAILVNYGIINGNDGNINPKDYITRAEISVIISKLYDLIENKVYNS